MILPNPKNALHRSWLYRLLSEIYDNEFLSEALYFKGGTAAAMLSWLDRFSIDLDFDLASGSEIYKVKAELEAIFKKTGLTIKDSSKNVPQYFLKYDAPENFRNTLKIDINYPAPKSNKYKKFVLPEIDRIVKCQTKETMFANKLVALMGRYEKNGSIAGRDLYDIWKFYLQGFSYDKDVITERRKSDDLGFFFKELAEFIKKEITQTIIDQDLNTLLENKAFQRVRKIIKNEVYVWAKMEMMRYEK
jgi:predicted nucleotidyltransferase component of viral defense system